MDYLNYKVSKVEEVLIKESYLIYMIDNNIDRGGYSQPELDHEFSVFRWGWIMGLSKVTFDNGE